MRGGAPTVDAVTQPTPGRVLAGRYRLEWGGQFENMKRAQTRLAIVVPVALLLIMLLLYLSFNSIRLAILVFTGVPFAAVGGIASLWLRGLPFSISAGVCCVMGVSHLGQSTVPARDMSSRR